MKKNSGITLLALIITIIIMLILAGVTISIVGGSDGIIAKAEKAVSETDKAAMQEDAELAIAAIKMEYYEDYSVNKYKTAKQFIVEELQKSPYETSRGARMQADDAGNVTYTYKSVATRLMIADNGSVTLGESSDSGDDDVPITPAVQYTVTYNANGGTGVPTDSKDYSTGSTITVLFNTVPTREGYTFLGWATNANATEAEYTSSEIKTFAMETANVTLYAVWEKVDYSYLFNFDATTGTILGIKEEYYGDRENIDYYKGYNKGYGWCVLTEPMDTLVIPSEIDGVEVKEIRYINPINVRKIVIEEGIEKIKESSTSSLPMPSGMVSYCTIEEVELPTTINSIDIGTFEELNLKTIKVKTGNPVYDSRDNCNAIIETATNKLIVGAKNTTIPSSVTTIGDKAFYKCTSLSTIEIPESVTSIGYSAFSECTSLSSINIPESVTSIGSSAFEGCTSLSSINIPDSVTSIESSAFEGCTSLSSVNIPSSVTNIKNNTFYGCINLSSVKIPSSVKFIESSAFEGCTSLSSINIPDSVTSIGSSAFEGCTSLSSVNIPSSVTKIGGAAFENCTRLSAINIPESVTSIGSSAFSGCKSLSSITIDSVTVATGLTSQYSQGYLVYYAPTVYIKTGVTPGSYITENFTKAATSDKTGYDKYTKN